MNGVKDLAIRHSILCVFFVFLLALFVGFGETAGFAADIIRVTTLSDDGPGSFRAAIESADEYEDVISFDVTGTITLNSTLQISGNKGLKIQGPGADLLVVSGNDSCRVFDIDTAESVDISGISIVSGDAGDGGGGIYNKSNGLTLRDCTFSGNITDYCGGGMFNSSSSPTVTNCTFSDNSAEGDGGGMYNSSDSNPEVTNCTFSGNITDFCGGGMSNYSSSPTVTNCTFYSNSSSYFGGGMFNDGGASPNVTNCTFSLNSANYYSGGGMCNYQSSPTLTNCIFWNDTGGEIRNDSSTTTLSYCVVQSDDYDESTISGYVTFADPVLQGLADNGGATQTCALGLGSSAIDKGTYVAGLDTDQRGHQRPWGSHPDIGAYEVDVESFTIIPYWTSGGTITPSSATVFEGESVDFTISPDISYHIENIYIDGESISFELVNDIYTHTFNNISADHGLFAVFKPIDDDDSTINRGGGGSGCNISAFSGVGLLLLIPMIFLSGKMK